MSYILPALNSRILQAFPVDLPRLAKFREPSPNCKAAIKPEMEIHLVSMFMTTALHSYLLGPTDSPLQKAMGVDFPKLPPGENCVGTFKELYVALLLLS